MRYVQELNYHPNLLARGLIKGRTGMIGFMTPSFHNPFYAELASEVEQQARNAGLRVLISMVSDDEVSKRHKLEDLLVMKVDGLLLMTGSLSEPMMQQVTGMSIPAVYCLCEGSEEDQHFPAVSFDFRHGGQLAAEHLLELGHRQMAIVCPTSPDGPPHHPIHTSGFLDALARYELTVEPNYFQAVHNSPEGGKEASYRLLTLSQRPTAIFATNDLMAIGVSMAAWELGLRVPEDISIVGFDSIALGRYTIPPLTSIAIDRATLVSQAITLLHNAIEGRAVSSPPLQAATLVVRGSTCSPA